MNLWGNAQRMAMYGMREDSQSLIPYQHLYQHHLDQPRLNTQYSPHRTTIITDYGPYGLKLSPTQVSKELLKFLITLDCRLPRLPRLSRLLRLRRLPMPSYIYEMSNDRLVLVLCKMLCLTLSFN